MTRPCWTRVAALALLSTGCSFAFSRGPAPQTPGRSVQEACGNAVSVPVDFVISTAYVVRALYVAGTGDGVTDEDAPLTRAVEVGGSLGAAALYLGSAFYGDAVNTKCARAQARWAGPSAAVSGEPR